MAITILPGQPYPLGATYDGMGTNFSVFSEVAERVELCLFDDDGTETRVDLPEVDAYCWHGYLPNMGPGQRYGFRVHGPYDPDQGLRCNPAKLLLDPYAKAVEGEVEWGEPLFAYRFGDPERSTQRRRQRPPHAQGGRHQPVLRLGQRPPPPHARGTRRSSTRSTSRASPSATPTSPRSCGAPTPGWPTRRRSST